MDKEIDYLNNIIRNKKHVYSGPKLLYKYRPFDDYTYDMLENKYLYLCPAEKLDDETECVTEISMNQIYDFSTNNLKRECVELIINLIRPYASSDIFDEVNHRIHRIMNSNGTVRPNLLLDLEHELQDMFPDVDTAPFVNFIVNIPKLLDEEKNKENNENLLNLAYNARQVIGVCSLCEFKDVKYMWENYAKDYSGYCIEYIIDDYEYNDSILPVVYNDSREFNAVTELLKTYINLLIEKMTNGFIKTEKTQFLRLFLSKFTKWSYQHEWRLIGGAGEKPKAPRIKAIYVNKNVNEVDFNKLFNYCINNEIDLIKL